MDLSALNSSLPPGLADAERDMGNKFRAAALSITTLYKSSLALNKHAYQVGYSAALSDVLSKLQSDIAAGEDAAVALARLMDWTEARQTAMAAFAADDDEPPVQQQQSQSQRAGPSSGLASAPRFAPQRPASAPVPEASSRTFRDVRERERDSAPGPSSLRTAGAMTATDAIDEEAPPRRSQTAVPTTGPVAAAAALDRSPAGLVAPIPLPSSSPTSSPSISRALVPAPLRLQRNASNRLTSSATSSTSSLVSGLPQLATSTFNFSIPTTIDLPAPSGPAQTGPIGSKRPIIDAEMTDVSLPSTPSRSGVRASKRRSLGLGLMSADGGVGEEKERGGERADRRRPPRRGGHGGTSGGARGSSPP